MQEAAQTQHRQRRKDELDCLYEACLQNNVEVHLAKHVGIKHTVTTPAPLVRKIICHTATSKVE